MARSVFVLPIAALLLAACNPSPKPAAAAVSAPAASSAAALATMNAFIHFANDQATLSDSAKALLDDKAAIFRANPAMRIIIVGYASEPGTEDYNFALGGRRATAAKDYLVAQGIDQSRIEIETRGQGELVVEGPGAVAAAQNRRDEFKLLIGSGYLVLPSEGNKKN